MIPVLGYMCAEEFTASGLVVKLGADGEVSLWTNMDNQGPLEGRRVDRGGAAGADAQGAAEGCAVYHVHPGGQQGQL